MSSYTEEAILDAKRPVNTSERRDAYIKSGWSEHDPFQGIYS